MISLRGTGEALVFEVADDGEGFDPALAPRGVGQTIDLGDASAVVGRTGVAPADAVPAAENA